MGVDIDVREIQAEQVAKFLAGTTPVNRYWLEVRHAARVISICNQPGLRR